MPALLYATPNGALRADDRLFAVGRSGWVVERPDRLIPLPAQATLVHLPGRRPLGMSASGDVVPLGNTRALAVAAVLPPGYLRTWLPAYEEESGAAVLPLYGYAAVGSIEGRPAVAAMRSDAWAAWDPAAPGRSRVRSAIAAAQSALRGNRLVPHLARCAESYRCLTAQNLFLGTGEGAIPVSPACNAACLGCISEQWGDVDSPQARLQFAPTVEEMVELAAWHLAGGARNFVSFGQGCEGEPLTRGSALVEATRRIRAAFPAATIHINTNGSRPRTIEALLDAGLNSVRLSIFSLHDDRFRAYYRPVGYGLPDLHACAQLIRRAGAQVTVNLLTFPGITDAPDEIEALLAFISDHGVHQVQLRSLNVDPLWLIARIPRRTEGIGMRAFVRRLQEQAPRLRLGNFTRPWRVGTPEPAVALG